MKTIIATILATILINFAQAQTVSNTDKNTGKNFSKNVADINAPSTKVEIDFTKSCKNAENIHWYFVPEGSLVNYSLNQKTGVRFYNKKGNLVYDILTYSEENLPHNIRDMVKQAYYLDYNITLVQEIHSEGKEIYIIQIKDKSTMKTLRICDDKMEVLNEYIVQQ